MTAKVAKRNACGFTAGPKAGRTPYAFVEQSKWPIFKFAPGNRTQIGRKQDR